MEEMSGDYPVDIGYSLRDDRYPKSSSFEAQCGFRYEFQPASVDNSVCGLVSTDNSNTVTVDVASTGAGGGIQFKGKLIENKEIECILIYDPERRRFVLEKMPILCSQLRHVRSSVKAKRNPVQTAHLKRKLQDAI
jgi:ELL-associated factor